MTRARTLFVLFVSIAVAVALASCGGGGGSDDPQAVVDDATLQGIESGKLDLAVKVGVEGKKGGDVDVSLSGPFQSEEDAELPELALSFAMKGEMDGKKLDREGGLTLLGNRAFVGYEGTEYAVDPTTFDFVKSMLERQGGGKGGSSDIAACQKAASGLEPNDLVENLKQEGSADVGGTETTKVSGDLDAAGALDAAEKLIEDPACSEQLKSAGPLPSTAELEEAESTVEDSVKSAHVELYVGDDHIIRRLTARATIEPPKKSDDSPKRVDLDIDLTLTGVNEEQSIPVPAATKPLSDLFVKLGINPIELLGALQGGGTQGLGTLLEKLGQAGLESGHDGGGSGGGQESYFECLGSAKTTVDVQNCTGLLQ